MCMHHASRISEYGLPQLWQIFDQLETSIPHDGFLTEHDLFEAQDVVLEASAGHVKPGSPTTPVTYHTAGFGNTILSLATRFDVLGYVQRKAAPKYIVFPVRDPFGPWSIMPLQLRRAGSAPWKNPLKKLLSRRTTSSQSTSDSTAAKAPGTEMAWPLLLDALFSRSSPNPTMVEILLRNGADPNFILNRYGMQTTVWTEALAFAVTLSTQEPSAASDAWAGVLQLMVTHGANIETGTIHQALRLVDEIYALPPSRLRVTTTSLQESFRKHKFGSRAVPSRFKLEDAEGVLRMSDRTYNPYNVSHIRREAARARK